MKYTFDENSPLKLIVELFSKEIELISKNVSSPSANSESVFQFFEFEIKFNSEGSDYGILKDFNSIFDAVIDLVAY